ELEVECGERGDVAVLDQRGRCIDDGAHGFEVGRVGALGGQRHAEDLVGRAHLDHVEHVVERQRGHQHALARQDLH
ncbi:hypothetical protein AAULH_14166, partial [Lactobacillus helveticus MTCC 5463]